VGLVGDDEHSGDLTRAGCEASRALDNPSLGLCGETMLAGDGDAEEPCESPLSPGVSCSPEDGDTACATCAVGDVGDHLGSGENGSHPIPTESDDRPLKRR
jgi:hypothetical protein